jgi:hypothetical protein
VRATSTSTSMTIASTRSRRFAGDSMAFRSRSNSRLLAARCSLRASCSRASTAALHYWTRGCATRCQDIKACVRSWTGATNSSVKTNRRSSGVWVFSRIRSHCRRPTRFRGCPAIAKSNSSRCSPR